MTSEINFYVNLDEHKVPETMQWQAPGEGEKGDCQAVFISIWDKSEKNTLKIDLWTKDMDVENMKQMVHQTLLTLSDTLQRATGEEKMAKDMRDFAAYYAEKLSLLSK